MACDFPIAVKAKLILYCYIPFTLLYILLENDPSPSKMKSPDKLEFTCDVIGIFIGAFLLKTTMLACDL